MPIRTVKSNVSSVGPSSMFLSGEGPTLETLDFTICIDTRQYTSLFKFRFVCWYNTGYFSRENRS